MCVVASVCISVYLLYVLFIQLPVQHVSEDGETTVTHLHNLRQSLQTRLWTWIPDQTYGHIHTQKS